MELATGSHAGTGLRSRRRLIGPDVVRAVAMAGVVVMNYHGYLVNDGAQLEGGWMYDLFHPWRGPLSTRFAATFVLTAGVGVTLLTRRALVDDAASGGEGPAVAEMRWRLVRRGAFLYLFGLAFDVIWPGTILPFYGAMFMVAALLFTMRARTLAVVGAGCAVAAWLIRWWRFEHELDGHDTGWLTDPSSRSPHGWLLDVLVNGTHPLLPWLVFLCAGIVLGRAMLAPRRMAIGWRATSVAAGLLLYSTASMVAATPFGGRWSVVLSDDPFERGIAYTASALGTALIAFAGISWMAERFRGTAGVTALRAAGQMSLTIYIAHALMYKVLVDWLDVVQPRRLGPTLTLAIAVWIGTTALAVAYYRRFGQGPAERVYRRITG